MGKSAPERAVEANQTARGPVVGTGRETIMRLALMLVGVLFASLAHAQDLTGTYVTQGKNGSVVVRMAVSGARLTGTLSVTGHPTVELLGYVAGRYTSGTIVGLGEFEAEVDGDTLHYVFAQGEGPNRPAMTVTLQLRRVDPGALARPQGGTMGAPAAPASGGGDPRLVGNWVSQSMISSGSASMASEQFLRFNADGSYAQGKGRSVAGGVNWSYQGGGGGDTAQGRWRAEDEQLYTLGQGGQWQHIGRYGFTTDGQTMRITYNNGNKKLWSRSR